MSRRQPRTIPALLLALSLVVAGCGSDEKPQKKGPSKAAVECRERWKALDDDVSGRDEKTNPSALAPRWNSIVATIDHYSTTARSSDCGDVLTDVEKSMTELTGFGDKLSQYDMELRLEQVRSRAEEYADSPRPKPSAGPAKKGKKGKKAKPAPKPPKPADVAKALRTLTQQAPRATAQQEAAWQQARAVDLDDSRAAKKAVKDLAFLSKESAAYRKSTDALAEIRKALRASKG